MSGHLPECPVPEMDGLWGLPMHPEDAKANCICSSLRACEERVLREQGLDSVYGQGFQAGREWMLRHFTENPPLSPAKAKPADLHDPQMGEMIHGDR